MFLHGGWLHFLGNMLYLWIFGDNVEDRLGHVRFVVFYLFCGAAAALAHVYMNPTSTIPDDWRERRDRRRDGRLFRAVSALARACARAAVHHLGDLEVPAIIFLGFWFLMQFFMASGSRQSADTGGVAFWAHIAGFVAGMAAVLVLRKPSRNRWRSELT